MLRIALPAAAFTLAVTLLPGRVVAQEINHKQADDFASWLVTDGQYAKAADLYVDAYKEKASTKFAYQAAELYFFVKDYANAAKYYEAVASSSNEYKDARLKVARSLKRMGRLNQAAHLYQVYADNYSGADSVDVKKQVAIEKAGVTLAIAEKERVDPSVFVDRLGQAVNGMKNEIAPRIQPDGSLMFISDYDGTMRAYASTQGRNGWSQMRPSEELPTLEEGHIGGGSLVGGNRFYYSVCGQSEQMTQPAVQCEVYVVRKRGGTWGKGRRLEGNVNVPGATSAQPFVFEEDGKEIMFFASDRAGGMGGMDIWKASRAAGDSAKFSSPVNVGKPINGPGDEVTPFFNVETRRLSYSSNGGVTLGGYDIWHATAKQGVGSFGKPVNPRTPINSSGDDYHYTEVVGTNAAYFSSSRAPKGVTAVNDDVYEATYDYPNIAAEFQVLDAISGQPVSDPTLTVYLNPDGREIKPMAAVRSMNGTYTINLPVDRDIKFDVTRPYFEDADFEFYIPEGEADGFQIKALSLVRAAPTNDGVQVVAGSTARSPAAAAVTTAKAAGGE